MKTQLYWLTLCTILGGVSSQWNPNFATGRSTIVHLFEWKWSSIAEECENFLGPYGYGGVQVSPPTENLILHSPSRPWYERYQPISYNLTTRSGNELEFQDMVKRCNAVSVRIYVDAVINHMTIGDGSGVGGCAANGLVYPCLPFDASHFNGPETCPTSSGYIEDYSDITQARNCKLGGLRDLNQRNGYVADKIKELLNRLISYGVAGFRVDASKHMWPQDLEPIYSTLNNLPTEHGFPSGSKSFFFQEVIDYGSDAFGTEYYNLGRVTEFRYGVELSNALRGGNMLKWLENFGEAWGFNSEENSVVFIDNNWIGPPSTNEVIDDITINPDLSCGGGWICEHRWSQIYGMNIFRNTVRGTEVTNWWSNGNNQIAFCRGNKGFIAINNDVSDMEGRLPAGDYCDIISGGISGTQCSGSVVKVGQDGMANFKISYLQDDPVLAIHIDAKL